MPAGPALSTTGPVTADDTATLLRAIAALPDDVRAAITDVHLIRLESAAKERIRRRSREVQDAFVDQAAAHRTIHVNAYSVMFRAAGRGQAGALTHLASVIAHEAWHVSHGAGEAGAYDEQLRVLTALKAPVSVLRRVRESRDYAVSKGR